MNPETLTVLEHGGLALIFMYLYFDLRARMRQLQDKHDEECSRMLLRLEEIASGKTNAEKKPTTTTK